MRVQHLALTLPTRYRTKFRGFLGEANLGRLARPCPFLNLKALEETGDYLEEAKVGMHHARSAPLFS